MFLLSLLAFVALGCLATGYADAAADRAAAASKAKADAYRAAIAAEYAAEVTAWEAKHPGLSYEYFHTAD